LNFLWNDVILFVKEGIAQGSFPKQISGNFKQLTRRDVADNDESPKLLPVCDSCISNCCSQLSGKVVLSLIDVARLVDSGHADAIDGSFRGFAKMLELYLETGNVSVFGEMGVLVSDQLNHDYMPSLKKKGSRCFFLSERGRCEIYSVRPESCRRFPFQYDHATKKISADASCAGLEKVAGDKERIEATKELLHAENERLKDMALLMLDAERVAAIGFASYL
ncbi:MAG: YkgJ family cysteine cluster protein, partial [Candidatus Margulisiibacteriota bacterium]